MRKPTPWPGLLLALSLSLALPLGTAAQSSTTEEPSPDAAAEVPLPELEGLAWYTAVDLAGQDMVAALPDDEVAGWQALVDGAGASLDALEYTYHAAFDPAALPDIGGVATVRVAGADTDVLRRVVIQDIVDQVVGAGHEAPAPREATIGDRSVTVVEIPDGLGFEDAVVYASGDVAWVLLLPDALVEPALAQLP